MAKRGKKWWTVAVVIVGLVVCVCGVMMYYAGNFMFNFALSSSDENVMKDIMRVGALEGAGETTGLQEIPPDVTQNWQQYCNAARDWFKTEGKEVVWTDETGQYLQGWLFEQESGQRYAIVCHGYMGHPAQMAGYIMKFFDMGYHVLAPAAQGHGDSDGDYYGMGWLERKHLLGWINTIIEEDPEAEILLFGLSMGGATVMMTAGEELPDNVKCIVEDCGYSSVWDEFSVQLENIFDIPDFPLMYVTDLLCRIRAGYSFREASAVEQLKKAEVPMLFIHGEEDTFVPYAMLEEVYTACASEVKEKLSVPGAAHGAAAATNPKLYWETIEEFVGKYFSSEKV